MYIMKLDILLEFNATRPLLGKNETLFSFLLKRNAEEFNYIFSICFCLFVEGVGSTHTKCLKKYQVSDKCFINSLGVSVLHSQ